MSDKKTSNSKEIPLHEAVLKIMFDENRERPAQLTVSEVYEKITDEAISEINILEVLTWLVAQKQVECTSGKFYSLDRFELIEQRIRDAKETGKELKLVTEDTPLHEVILSLMYEADPYEPAKLTADDVYWMISDPKVHKSLVGDALEWLLNQGRVEYLAGKYSLDRIEFRDQHKASEKAAIEKKPSKKPAVKKKETPKEQPKIVIPPSKEEETPVKKKPQAKPIEPVLESTSPSVPKKAGAMVEDKKAEQPQAIVTPHTSAPADARWRMPVLIVAVICVIYTFYLLFVLNQSVSMTPESRYSVEINKEVAAAQSKLNEVSQKGSSNNEDIAFLQERLESIEEFAENRSKDTLLEEQNARIRSLVHRLIGALLVTLSLVSLLVFTASNKAVRRK